MRSEIKRRIWRAIHHSTAPRDNPRPWTDWLFAALVAAGIFYLIFS